MQKLEKYSFDAMAENTKAAENEVPFSSWSKIARFMSLFKLRGSFFVSVSAVSSINLPKCLIFKPNFPSNLQRSFEIWPRAKSRYWNLSGTSMKCLLS